MSSRAQRPLSRIVAETRGYSLAESASYDSIVLARSVNKPGFRCSDEVHTSSEQQRVDEECQKGRRGMRVGTVLGEGDDD